MLNPRLFNPIDQLISTLDNGVKTLFGGVTSERPNPARNTPESDISEDDRKHIAGLMRINHTGEVCAQALYQGQALTAKTDAVQACMTKASQEENDHLDWCASRLEELNSHKSRLNPLWYAGSFAMGALAGWMGDRWSLGFVAETENQVVKHLESHLDQLPQADEKTRAILEQMILDEAEHATKAMEQGGRHLPGPVQKLMTMTAKLMTKTAYKV